tara:strand:+ start:165 stop:1055 length:891 start_codon:yes stop_codon:yes gene_type:complete
MMEKVNLITNFSYTLNLFYKNSLILFYNKLNIIKNNSEKLDKKTIQKIILILLNFCLYTILSDYSQVLLYCNSFVLKALYWVILGIFSTIGFGFGLQTGVFFVVPFILNEYNNTLQITEHSTGHLDILEQTVYTKLSVFFKTLPIVICWGIGSAIGEIPPFLIAKYNTNKGEVLTIINASSFRNVLLLLERYKFRTIIFMSAWPNFTFDMCGLMCGYYDMSLPDFLIPTIIGKSLIKSPLQSLFIIFVYSYSNDYIKKSNKTSILIVMCNLCFSLIILYFIKLSIEKVAKMKFKND